MNKQKITRTKYHKTLLYRRHISFVLLIAIILSSFSINLVQCGVADTLAISTDDTTTNPTSQETKDTSTANEPVKTEPIPKDTTTSTTIDNQNPSSTTMDDTKNSDLSTTQDIKDNPSSDSTTDPPTTDTSSNDQTTTTKTDSTDQKSTSPTINTIDSPQLDTTSIQKSEDNNTSDTIKATDQPIKEQYTFVDQTEEINAHTTNETTTITSNIDYQIKGEIGSIKEDTQITVKTNKENDRKTMIREVDFTVAKTYDNVTLSVSELKEKPEEITQNLSLNETTRLYKYIDVKLTANENYIGESGISSMTFTFTIEKTWIDDHMLDKNKIIMMRYHNHTWNALNTTFLNESDEFFYYQAETPGLSVFAVVGDTIVEDSAEIIDGSTHIPIWVSLGIIASSTMILGVVLVKKRFIYRK